MNIQKIEKIEEEVIDLRKKKNDCQYLLKEVFYNQLREGKNLYLNFFVKNLFYFILKIYAVIKKVWDGLLKLLIIQIK